MANIIGLIELTFDASLMSDRTGANLEVYIQSTTWDRNLSGFHTYWSTDISAVRFTLATYNPNS